MPFPAKLCPSLGTFTHLLRSRTVSHVRSEQQGTLDERVICFHKGKQAEAVEHGGGANSQRCLS